jgi:hypothetical protein
MTNRDNISRLYNGAASAILTLPGQRNSSCRLDADVKTLEKLCDAVTMELNSIDPSRVAEAFDIKGLHDRLHTVLVQLRAIRHALDSAEARAEEAIKAIRIISSSVEEVMPGDEDL